ncbi:hypothetical protein [Pengzhenrongella sp.]|jgi:hypothetical protein|uniref:hypothetical protein n=1 Tax=Pengzhenrongella sp. TaxID=2888820 RepID=UPI002F929E65
MVTLPLFLILLVVAYISVRHGKARPGGMVLGVLLGLAMATTAIGPPLLAGLTTLSTTAIQAISSAVGGA